MVYSSALRLFHFRILSALFLGFLWFGLSPTFAGTIDSASLSITKTDDVDPVAPAGTLVYTIQVSNEGPSDAVDAQMNDTLPAGASFLAITPEAGWSCTTPAVGATGTLTCSIATFPPGIASFSLSVRADAGPLLINTATVTSTTPDPSDGDNSAEETTTVGTASPSLSITVTDTPDPVVAGADVTYTVTATTTLDDNQNVALRFVVPANAGFQSLLPPAGVEWTCTAPSVGASGLVECTRDFWTPGSAVLAATVRADAGLPPGTILDGTGSIELESSGRPVVATATEPTTVVSPATLSVTKSVSGTFEPGSFATYTIVITNQGPATQFDNPGPELTDPLSPDFTPVSVSSTSGTAIATNVLNWDGSIPAGGTVAITLLVRLSSLLTPGTTVSNQATVAYDADGNGTNEASASSDDPATATAGDPTVFQVVGAPAATEIPTLGRLGLAALGVLMGLAAVGLLLRRRSLPSIRR
ncbi:MAG TPA: hypothetical protein VGS22_08460 [Thermoanaerobaculia bacterium]|jgi:uncharacterized repeat protein (TIGR01451 family)|nr:hypothetical protein [Thermoanaerobaculia bacterium]